MNQKLKSLLPRDMFDFDSRKSDQIAFEGLLYKGVVFYWCPLCQDAHKVANCPCVIAPGTLLPQQGLCKKLDSIFLYIYVHYYYEVFIEKSKIEIKEIMSGFRNSKNLYYGPSR